MENQPKNKPFKLQPPSARSVPFNRNTQQVYISSLEYTVCKHLVKFAREDYDRLSVIKDHAMNTTGQRRPVFASMYEVGFPVALLAQKPTICSISEVLTKFEKTSLFKCWTDRMFDNIAWSNFEERGIAFNWVGWGVCIMHNTLGHDLDNTIIIREPEEDERYLYIEPVDSFAKKLATRW